MHYVCCDIHGQYDLYMELLRQIDLQPEDTLYVLGDVIDRGPDSIGILKDMMERDNVEMFIGNHEMMMLDYLGVGGDKSSWFYGNNGGQITHSQYMALPWKEQALILRYLKHAWIQKYITVDGTDYALHHSYFLPRRKGENVRYCEESGQADVFKAVWYSPYRMWEYAGPSEYDDGYVHLIGHVPVQNFHKERPPLYNDVLGDRLINLDGGCALLYFGYQGGLYCMSLEKDESGERKEFWIPGQAR